MNKKLLVSLLALSCAGTMFGSDNGFSEATDLPTRPLSPIQEGPSATTTQTSVDSATDAQHALRNTILERNKNLQNAFPKFLSFQITNGAWWSHLSACHQIRAAVNTIADDQLNEAGNTAKQSALSLAANLETRTRWERFTLWSAGLLTPALLKHALHAKAQIPTRLTRAFIEKNPTRSDVAIGAAALTALGFGIYYIGKSVKANNQLHKNLETLQNAGLSKEAQTALALKQAQSEIVSASRARSGSHESHRATHSQDQDDSRSQS